MSFLPFCAVAVRRGVVLNWFLTLARFALFNVGAALAALDKPHPAAATYPRFALVRAAGLMAGHTIDRQHAALVAGNLFAFRFHRFALPSPLTVRGREYISQNCTMFAIVQQLSFLLNVSAFSPSVRSGRRRVILSFVQNFLQLCKSLLHLCEGVGVLAIG